MSTARRTIGWTLAPLALSLVLAGCGDDGATEPEPEPVLEVVEVVQGGEQVGSVGLPLDTLVLLRAVADDGSPMADVVLQLAVTGDGTVDPASASTGADGTVGVEWTLATVPGLDTLTVTPAGRDSPFARITATGLADRPDTMALMDGDEQTELAGHALPAPIRVRLVDAYGNPVVGVPVEFTALTGGGVIEPAEAETDLDGIAAAGWTLGAAGPQSAEALVRDSVVYDLVDLAGSPVPFTATAVGFALDSVTPAPAAVGDAITLTGTGFGPDPGDNEVWLDGRVATVVDVSQTAVAVEVPSFGCTAAQSRRITIARGPDTATTEVDVEPADLLMLGPGERVVLDAAGSCMQLPGSTDPDSALYLVGLTSTRQWSAAAAFEVTGRDSTVAEVAAASAVLAAAPADPDPDLDPAPLSPELRLRSWERSFLATADPVSPRAAPAGGPVLADVPGDAAVGDDLSFRVPYVHTDPCNDYSTRVSTVVYTGPQVVVAIPEVPDLVLPTLLGSAAFQAARAALMTVLEGPVWSQVADYVGDLGTAAGTLDADGRATVVFTSALYGQDVPPVFSTAVDLLDRTTCPSSDEGVFIYVTIPPLDYSSLAAALAELQSAMTASPPGITHQLTHAAQSVRRLSSGVSRPLPAWIAEGHAELLVEAVGHALQGRGPGMDYGAAVVTADATATRWYLPLFERLAYHHGWDGASGRVAGAPGGCSLYGFGSVCDPRAGPGAAWSFVRYISDRVGPDLAGGEAELSRAITLVADRDELDALLASHTGVGLDRLIVDWAATLHTDGRLDPTVAPDLQLGSWDLADIYGAIPAARRPTPMQAGFESFGLVGSVIGGGTAYLAIGASGGHGPVAVRFTDPLGGPLSADIEPRVWVVRVR